MTRLDAEAEPEHQEPVACDGPLALLLDSREVPLGGVRGMSVQRALPQRALPMVGAWCFLDRFGPQTTRMRVEPHPHIGLQTVTWPLEGEIRHRDTIGSDVLISPGQLNLMTSGSGIAHSEYSVGDGQVFLDALQFWVALPESRRHGAAAFEQHTDLPTVPLQGGGVATVVMGEFAGITSPATVHTPIVGAQVTAQPGARARLPLHPTWEYAIVGVEGDLTVHTDPATAVGSLQLLSLGIGRTDIEISSATGARLFVIGGEPFEDDIVMWWNFVGRSHEEIVEARDAWEADTDRFGHVVGHGDERVPAPPLPTVRLTKRRRRP